MKITLALPPSINSYYSTNRQGRRFKTTSAKDWEESEGYTLLQELRGVTFGNQQVKVIYHFYFKDDRSDYGNRTKILDDLLQRQGIIDNDKQIMEAHIYKNIDKNCPRVEVEISPLPSK